jgi:lipoprotein-releasing system permease protein
MRFEAFIAGRYLRGKRRNRFVSIITFIAVAGVSIGVIALIVVMSVMTGFDRALRATIIGNRSHMQVVNAFGGPMLDPDRVIDEIEALNPEIVASSPFIEVLGILQKPRTDRYEGVFFLGVDIERETAVTQIAENLTGERGRTFGFGELPGRKEVMLGYVLADRLDVSVDDAVFAITPRGAGTPIGWKPGQRLALTVSGISQAQMMEFDTVYAFVNLDTAAQLKGQEGVDGVHCRLTDPFVAQRVADRIESELGYRAITWYESQRSYFEALQQEKVVMFIILVFIILVAACNITSILIMIVMEKRRDIGILRTLGVGTRTILRLFILEGLYIGLTGTAIGVAVGTFIAWNLNAIAEVVAWFLGVDLFSSQIYYFDRIPVAILWQDVLWITVSAVVLTFLATLYPAWSASRVDPVDALRNE